ncbi:MAG: hypothetical protein JWM41_4282 [Gemmatimonadetes bacterium]|nr:hypothetical protein [Gemmatimonadota bacterium]
MEVLRTIRVLSGARRGSSRPILVETNAGPRLVKLRGVPQGTGPLVAEIVVGAIAESLGLAVPARCLVDVDADAYVPEGDDELRDVMVGSGGINLGFDYLDPARDLAGRDTDSISADDRAAILWLDRFVMNPDRTARNPNLMRSRDRTWLIDHGAALGFQYDWSLVTESTPARPPIELDPHLFASSVLPEDLLGWDEIFSARVTRAVLESALAEVPDIFLEPLLGSESPESSEHRRAAYVAFLWKRLEAPRGFLVPALVASSARRGRPPRLARP